MAHNPVTGEPICDENHPDADYDEWRETRRLVAERERDEGSEADEQARDELLQPRAWE